MLKDPEVLKELQNSTTDKKLEALLEEISVGDDDTIETVSKKYQQKLTGLVEYFNGKLQEVETSAVDKATAPQREKEAQTIREFSEKNPGMKNPDVVAMMQPLYDKGMPLEDAYKRACKGLDLDPTTGETPVEKEEDEGEPKDKAKGEKPKTSMRTSLTKDADFDEGDSDEGEKKPLNIDEALAASHNEFIAKNGDPFDKK